MARQPLPLAKDRLLQFNGNNLQFDSQQFYSWLRRPSTKSFRAETSLGSFTASKRSRNGRNYWYATQTRWGIQKNAFIADDITLSWLHLEAAAEKLNKLFAPLEEMEAAGENLASADNPLLSLSENICHF